MENEEILHKSSSNRWVMNRIHSLLSRADASWQHLTYVTHIAILYFCIILTSKSRSRKEYIIPTDNIIVLDHFFKLTKKSDLIGRL